jgi:hypothetical protein
MQCQECDRLNQLIAEIPRSLLRAFTNALVGETGEARADEEVAFGDGQTSAAFKRPIIRN